MPSEKKSFDFWYAVHNTQIVRAPSRALETFGETRIHYYHLAELPDVPGKVRVREGRLEAHKPLLITPEAYVQEELSGFGEQARQYLDFLKQNQDSIRILQYGYRLSQESFSEQIVTDSLDAVAERVGEEVKRSEDPFAVVIKGVDDPWDVSLIHFFWLHVNASAPVNVRDFERVRREEMEDSTPRAVREEVERAFEQAQTNPALVKDLGVLLQKHGVFDRYQDRFFKLVRRG
ncbi:MAG: hypothetical protein J6V72_07545 [Kiritimatiellae bacterium]|nr:hypothetical protein [Kiritimatiellia bacterium]